MKYKENRGKAGQNNNKKIEEKREEEKGKEGRGKFKNQSVFC